MKAPLLAEVMPELATELEALLTDEAEPKLVAQVRRLRIVDWCRCDDEVCALFYTAPRPEGDWGAGHRNISFDCTNGMLILDVVNNKVAAVEVLYREDVRRKLQEILP